MDSRKAPTCCAVASAWSNIKVTDETPVRADTSPQPAWISSEMATRIMTRWNLERTEILRIESMGASLSLVGRVWNCLGRVDVSRRPVATQGCPGYSADCRSPVEMTTCEQAGLSGQIHAAGRRFGTAADVPARARAADRR